MKYVLMTLVTIPALAMAQALPPDSGVSALDQIMHALANIPAAGIIGFLTVLEIALRFIPTAQPASVLVVIKKVLDGLVYIMQYASSFLVKVIEIANRVK